MLYNRLFFEELKSTNDYAWQHVREFDPGKITIIQSAYQKAGRGQGNHRWYAEPHQNLLFTLCIPVDEAKDIPLFSVHHLIALAVHQYIEEAQHQVKAFIKWPNDIVVEGKKIAGILIENLFQGNALRWIFAGVGINVNQQIFHDDVEGKATSLKLLDQKDRDLEKEMNNFLNVFDLFYQRWRSKDWEILHRLYNEHLWKKGSMICLYRLADNAEIEGKFLGVEPHGSILIEFQGQRLSFMHHEARWIKN